MFIKLSGIVLIMLGSIALGESINYKRRKRIRELQSIHRACMILQSEITYAGATLAESFQTIASRIGEDSIRQIFLQGAAMLCEDSGITFQDIWTRLLECNQGQLQLKEEDLRLLGQLGSCLGFQDRQMQLNAIGQYMLQLQQAMEQAQQELPAQLKVTRSVGISMGVLISIVLI